MSLQDDKLVYREVAELDEWVDETLTWQQWYLPAPYPHDSYCNHDEQGPVSLSMYLLPYKHHHFLNLIKPLL